MALEVVSLMEEEVIIEKESDRFKRRFTSAWKNDEFERYTPRYNRQLDPRRYKYGRITNSKGSEQDFF